MRDEAKSARHSSTELNRLEQADILQAGGQVLRKSIRCVQVDMCRGIPRLLSGGSESPAGCYDRALERYAPLTVAILHSAPDSGKRSGERSESLSRLRQGSDVPVHYPGSSIRTSALVCAARTSSPCWSVTRQDIGEDASPREVNGATSHHRKLVDLAIQLISLRSRIQSKRRRGLRPRVR